MSLLLCVSVFIFFRSIISVTMPIRTPVFMGELRSLVVKEVGLNYEIRVTCLCDFGLERIDAARRRKSARFRDDMGRSC